MKKSLLIGFAIAACMSFSIASAAPPGFADSPHATVAAAAPAHAAAAPTQAVALEARSVAAMASASVLATRAVPVSAAVRVGVLPGVTPAFYVHRAARESWRSRLQT